MKKKDQNEETPATAHDVKLVQDDLEMLGGHLSSRIEDVREELSSQIHDVREDLSSRIDGVREELSSRIDGVEETLVEIKDELVSQRKVSESLLKVVESIEGRYQETRGDHEKIENHNDRIVDLEVQVRMLQK